MPTVPDIHRRGTRAAQGAATSLTIGTLWFVTDEGVTERWTGTVWESWSGVAAHAASHASGGSDPVTIAESQVTGLTAALAAKVATTDPRLSDARTPTAHAPTHKSGGSDPIKLDELAAPTDVTTLNATASAHGLLPKLSGVATDVFKGDGTFSAPAGGAPSAHHGSHETGGADAIVALDAGVLTTGTIAAARLPPRLGTIGLVIDGGGSVITTGVKGFLRVPFACTILAATLLSTDAAATAGSIVIDIWKDTYANYPPTVADTITASAKPTLASANKSEDTTLTGWTTAVAAGDVLGFTVDSIATLTRVALSLTVQAS
jgi:hypothetical protein